MEAVISSESTDKLSRTVFVGNISYDVTEDALLEIFQGVGPVVSIKLVHDSVSGRFKGYGFCEYRDSDTAMASCRSLNGYVLNERALNSKSES